MDAPSPVAGLVIGTEPATPLEFWVGVREGAYLQLDDVVVVDRVLPDGQRLRISGVVSQVRATHEGARFDSDVFLVADGVLPAQVSEAAQVQATRFEPEVFVPPLPGEPVRKAVGAEREDALLFSQMRQRLPAGLSRDDEPFFLNLEFLDGTRGAHVNISAVSGMGVAPRPAGAYRPTLWKGPTGRPSAAYSERPLSSSRVFGRSSQRRSSPFTLKMMAFVLVASPPNTSEWNSE